MSVNKRNGSIVLMVMIISASLIALFMAVAQIAYQYRDQIQKIYYWMLVSTYLESAIEEAWVSYFEYSKILGNKTDARRQSVLYGEIKDNANMLSCSNCEIKAIDKDILVDPLNKELNIAGLNKIWEVKVSASRLVNEIKVRLMPFTLFEFRLTAEEREKMGNWSQDKIKRLKIDWMNTNYWTVSAWLDLIQIKWPLWNKWDIETHRISFKDWWGYVYWDLWSSKPPELAELNLPTNAEYALEETKDAYEYIFIFKSKLYPLDLRITWLNERGEVMLIPDRNVHIDASANVSNEDKLEEYLRTKQVQRSIYTNFDSNFDYAGVLWEI